MRRMSRMRSPSDSSQNESPGIQDPACGRFLQADQMTQQGALAATAAPHDDKDIAPSNGECQIPLDDGRAIGHGQAFHFDVGRYLLRWVGDALHS